MKRFIWLLPALLLVGCSPLANSAIVEEPPKKWAVDKELTFQYELTPKNNAYLNNTGITKLLSCSTTGDCFTYMVPRFYTYSQFPKGTKLKSDAYLKLESAKREEDVEPSIDNVIYEFCCVSEDTGSTLVNELSEEYADKFKVSKHVATDIKLSGEELNSSGVSYTPVYIYGEEEYAVPHATYFFKLESGNYLCLHISVESVSYPDLYKYEAFAGDVSKDVLKQLKVYQESIVDFDNLATYIMDYVLVGDYSDAYTPKQSDTSVWERLETEDTDPSTFEEVEDFSTEVKDTPSHVVEEHKPSVEDAPAYDYDTEIREFFD